MKIHPVIFILGPTAVGKSAVAISLAKKTDAEIISADSRQIYKYMDIGTAKPGLNEQEGITHHLLDNISPGEPYSVGKFVAHAAKIVADLRLRKKNAIICGGTGLYVKALIDGIAPLDFHVQPTRDKLEAQLKSNGLATLFNALQELDPVLAKRINPNDRQRILRGLEVVLSTGKPLSEWHKKTTGAAGFPYKMFGLSMERERLYQRINQRVDRMLEQGLLDEVDRLLKMDFTGSNALNAVGYKEVVAYRNGESDYKEMVELIKRNSRRFAKRQLTWFRKDERIQWIDSDKKSMEEMVRTILSLL